MSKPTRYALATGGGILGLAIVAGILIALNIIVGNLGLRADLTEEHLYRLSDGTKTMLAALDRPVTLKFFFNGSAPEVPIQLKQFAQRVEDLLAEYEAAADGNVEVEKYDPKPDSDAEEWAQRYGLSGQQLGLMGPSLYLGLVATRADVDAVLPLLDPRTENLLEYNISRIITRISRPQKPVLGILSTLPVMGAPPTPYPMPQQPPPSQPWFAFRDLQQDYALRTIETTAERIDDDVDALIVVHPRDLSDATLYAIDQFVLRGGGLMVFVDPLCVTELQSQATPQMRFGPRASDLKELFGAWNVAYEPGKTAADLQAITRLRAGQGNRVEESPVWLSLSGANLSKDDIITSHLESLMMPCAGAFTASSTPEVDVRPLIRTSDSAALVDAMTAQFSIDGVRRDFKSGMKPLNLALRLHGKFNTAFPAGLSGETNAVDAASEGLKESRGKSTVLLVADVDMLFDQFAVQDINFFGYRAQQPINDNLAFLANAVELIAGSTALVDIRTRGKTERPFEVVLDLQRKAQARWLEQEQELQGRLEEAQRRLGELQAKKDEKQRFILSPEQKQEIERFNKQVAETKGELKLVRRKLREDIERLGILVKVVNIVLMPAIVVATGIGFGISRRRRTRR